MLRPGAGACAALATSWAAVECGDIRIGSVECAALNDWELRWLGWCRWRVRDAKSVEKGDAPSILATRGFEVPWI
jgi:hypothetical protein